MNENWMKGEAINPAQENKNGNKSIANKTKSVKAKK
jgi:hypothetical protein